VLGGGIVTERGIGVGQLDRLGSYEHVLGDLSDGIDVVEQSHESPTLKDPAG
jgi:hypothetical protein